MRAWTERPVWIAGAVLLGLGLLGAEDELVFPPGPIADLIGRLEPGAAATALPEPAWPDWHDRSPAGWGGEPAWRRWVELLRAEARAERPDPERRVQLALLARAQARDSDAWRHLLAAAEKPALVGAVLPAFLPGVPLAALGDRELPDGVVLRPALPPAVADAKGALRAIAGRPMEHRRVRIGGALVWIRVVVEGDGVQIDVNHREGPEVRVRIVPPVPPGVEIGAVYADWERVENEDEPVELVVSSEAPRHSVWGRFLPRTDLWPAPFPGEGGVTLPRAQLQLVVPEEEREAPHFARLAETLGELFGVPCELTAAGPPTDEHLFEPVAIRIGAGPEGERKLAAMISLIENYALAGAVPR